MRGRNASRWAGPRLLTLLAAVTLAFGADAGGRYVGWTRAMWTQAARADTGVLPPFRYYATSAPYNERVGKLRLRCRMYGGAQAVQIVCVIVKPATKGSA